MREILFRGKTEDGYWVKGNLIKNEDASFIAKTEAYSFIDGCSKADTKRSKFGSRRAFYTKLSFSTTNT